MVKRFRAAVAYAGLSVPKLAERVADEGGLSASTLYDVQQGRRPRSPLLSRGEMAAIARACELPEGFFSADFAEAFGPSAGVDRRLEQFEARLRQLEAGQDGSAPPGELGRDAEDSPPSVERQGQGANHTEAGRRPGGGK